MNLITIEMTIPSMRIFVYKIIEERKSSLKLEPSEVTLEKEGKIGKVEQLYTIKSLSRNSKSGHSEHWYEEQWENPHERKNPTHTQQ